MCCVNLAYDVFGKIGWREKVRYISGTFEPVRTAGSDVEEGST